MPFLVRDVIRRRRAGCATGRLWTDTVASKSVNMILFEGLLTVRVCHLQA